MIDSVEFSKTIQFNLEIVVNKLGVSIWLFAAVFRWHGYVPCIAALVSVSPVVGKLSGSH